MAQAALALPETDAALDNVGERYVGPPTDGDRWVWIIERFKTISEPLAVCAAQKRRTGMPVEIFASEMLAVFRTRDLEDLRSWGRNGALR